MHSASSSPVGPTASPRGEKVTERPEMFSISNKSELASLAMSTSTVFSCIIGIASHVSIESFLSISVATSFFAAFLFDPKTSIDFLGSSFVRRLWWPFFVTFGTPRWTRTEFLSKHGPLQPSPVKIRLPKSLFGFSEEVVCPKFLPGGIRAVWLFQLPASEHELVMFVFVLMTFGPETLLSCIVFGSVLYSKFMLKYLSALKTPISSSLGSVWREKVKFVVDRRRNLVMSRRVVLSRVEVVREGGDSEAHVVGFHNELFPAKIIIWVFELWMKGQVLGGGFMKLIQQLKVVAEKQGSKASIQGGDKSVHFIMNW
ncbi:galactose oxidase/kelch repeat superfamily protein [Striga asiatica]|uniref:Galactose oxidase/kelch repeat superfamily protein n=1 Tax=Striga asiatica TaxID=4170 RepID=A0A5A7RA08_STRAF|nr:galactose oxidase/kelch repeat superfamily protein [Striga asiatica]